MKYDKVTIKQIPDDYAVMTGLHKHGRSKMPKTIEYLQVGIGSDGRYITGLDETSMEINKIKDPAEREAKALEIKELRESLEFNLKKDLSPTSTFWETFGIQLSSDSDLILNRSNNLQVVMYHALVANHYVAPDKDSASRPEYRAAKYYCHVVERASEEEAVDRLTKDRAKAKLVAVFENHDLMVMLGQYLEGDKYKEGMSDKTLYNMLSTFVDNPKEPENIKKFMKAAAMDVADLQYKITIDRAIKKKIIRYKDGYYQRGQVTLGKNPTEVYNNLRKPDYATEFLSIQEEIEELA